jgi:LacI family transcriptional regulator
MSVTLKDIAKKTGVTVATVSRALSNKDRVSDEVKKRILREAKRLNYKRKKSGQKISYVIDKRFFLLTSHFYNRVIQGIEEGLDGQGYSFQFTSLDPDKFSISNIDISGLAGIIATSVYHDSFILQLKGRGIPLVLLDHFMPDEDIDAVNIDNSGGISIGYRHLASLGHKRIVYLAGDMSAGGPVERLLGYRRAVESSGSVVDDSLILPCDFSIQSAYEAMKSYLDRSDADATAVMAVNDIVAIGAMEAIKGRKLRIPEDVSVLGFDDIDLAGDVIPRLSTVDVKKRMMGWHAATRLVQIINGAETGFLRIMLRPALRIRESTGLAASSVLLAHRSGN